MKRVFIFVLDSCGIGAMPDAARFGDSGADTLKRISQSDCFSADNMKKFGLSCIDGLSYLGSGELSAAVARLGEKSNGKDTTVGHWEIAGLVSERPLPTYPNGFPRELLARFSKAVGRGVLCNKPYSGTDVIRDYGEEHIKTGDLIVYTSADSVFQIAAHEGIVPLDELYKICKTAREILTGEHAVGRVIARPFDGVPQKFYRTKNRHDYSLPPQGKTLLDYITEAGLSVFAIGKINDIFAGQGISEYVYTESNNDGMEKALLSLSRESEGLTFVNLVDFDSSYGHREDIDGYAKAFADFDSFLPKFIAGMRQDDMLIITADHGCDPGDGSTDHTREYVPLIVIGEKIIPGNLGTREGFSCIAATVAEYLSVPYEGDGESLLKEIYKG
ncbi:MAG: phosphopentomutase [Clostridia bacterium]|nr:phosphopentomutase [Clostridia bacterium]